MLILILLEPALLPLELTIYILLFDLVGLCLCKGAAYAVSSRFFCLTYAVYFLDMKEELVYRDFPFSLFS